MPPHGMPESMSAHCDNFKAGFLQQPGHGRLVESPQMTYFKATALAGMWDLDAQVAIVFYHFSQL